MFAHLAPVACLPSAIGDAFLPRARLLCGVLLLVGLLLLLVVDVVVWLVLVVVLLLHIMAQGLCGHVLVVDVLAVSPIVVVVVHGALDRHGLGAAVVVLRRLRAKVLGVFRLTLARALPLASRLLAGGACYSSNNKTPGQRLDPATILRGDGTKAHAAQHKATRRLILALPTKSLNY